MSYGDRFEVGTAQQEIQANRAYLDIDIDGDSGGRGESYGEYQCAADVFLSAEARDGARREEICLAGSWTFR